MKYLIYSLMLCVSTPLALNAGIHADALKPSLVAPDSVDLATREVMIATFGRSVSELLSSSDDLYRETALRHIIRDGARTTFSRDDVYNVVRIYRDHGDDNMRRMAVVALGQMNDAWAMDFLSRSTHFEETPQVLHTMVAVLAAYDRSEPQEPVTDPELARRND